MAPANLHRFQTRSIDSGIAFSAIFGAIAGSVVICCLIWGFLVPYIRKKNQLQASTTRRLSSNVTLYDPRQQTPFRGALTNQESIVLTDLTTPRSIRSAQNAHVTTGLFTPVKSRDSSCPQPRMPKSYTLPRVRTRSDQVQSAAADRDFGDAREYILALPEPLRLRSPTQQNRLVGSNTLGRLPSISRLPSAEDKHLHPNKLFQRLDRGVMKRSQHGVSSVESSEPQQGSTILETAVRQENDAGSISALQASSQHDVFQLDPELNSEHAESLVTATPPHSDLDETESSHNASIAAMHRLRTYRSLIGAPPPEPLSRAGTLTRPKTPVARMRDIYDRSASENRTTRRTASRNDTISSLFQTIGNSSDGESTHSSATSPQKQTPEPFTNSTSSLLPTPLHIVRSPRGARVSSVELPRLQVNVEFDRADRSQTASVASVDDSAEEAGLKVESHNAETLANRPRPPPLTLAPSTRMLLQKKSPSTAHSPMSGRAVPSLRRNVPSVQASSVYSRDTQGLSIARTPATSDFPPFGTLAYRPPFSPYIPSTIDDTSDSNIGTEASLVVKDKTSPVDAAKRKVENWNVDMPHLDFNTSPSPSLKQALSTLGPDCASTHEAQESDDTNGGDGENADIAYRHSTISTEINPSEARLSSLAGTPLRVQDASDANNATPTRKGQARAPSGTGWV